MKEKLEILKDKVANERGYPSWLEMQDFIINHNLPVNVAVLLVAAMEDVFYKSIEQKNS